MLHFAVLRSVLLLTLSAFDNALIQGLCLPLSQCMTLSHHLLRSESVSSLSHSSSRSPVGARAAASRPGLLGFVALIFLQPYILHGGAVPGELAHNDHNVPQALKQAPVPDHGQEGQQEGIEGHARDEARPPGHDTNDVGYDHDGGDGREHERHQGEVGAGAVWVGHGIDGLVVVGLQVRVECFVAALGLCEGFFAVDLEW